MAKTPRKRARKRTRTKAGWAGDPLVSIAPAILRAAMKERGVSVAALCRRVGGNEQTLAHLTKDAGKKGLQGVPIASMKKTRASRRKAIADALDVAEELLAGQLSYMPRSGPRWYEYMYSVQTWLSAQRLLVKVDAAVCRDLAARSLGAASSDLRPEVIRSQVEDVMNALMRVGVWRTPLLRWTPARPTAQGYLEPLAEDPTDPLNSRPVIDDAHEAGLIALIHALEHLLAPWFDGRAALDYVALRAMATPMPPIENAERESPQAILHGSPVVTFRRDIAP